MENPASPPPDERLIGFIRQARPLYRESSLQAAVDALRGEGVGAAAVLDGPFVVGAVWAPTIQAAVLGGEPLHSAIRRWVDPHPPVLAPNCSSHEARALLAQTGSSALIVADADGRYLGLLSALDLFHGPEAATRPPFVGGLATPFGVFLTNGEVTAGVGGPALAATGALLFVLFLAGIALSYLVVDLAGNRLAEIAADAILYFGPAVLFFALLRLLPLSATHGAEHMVVHAIERREPLSYEVVKRMPRVHPRCGTNFAIGAMLFVMLIELTWEPLRELGALLSLAVTLALWRPAGGVLQAAITTRTPNRKQIEAAIRVGEELLAEYRRSSRPTPAFWRRLMRSGLPWVLAGAAAASAAAYAVASGLGVRLP